MEVVEPKDISEAEARKIVAEAESAFMAADISSILASSVRDAASVHAVPCVLVHVDQGLKGNSALREVSRDQGWSRPRNNRAG